MTRKVSILISICRQFFSKLNSWVRLELSRFAGEDRTIIVEMARIFCLIFPRRFPKWHQVLSIQRSIMINICMYQPASHLLLQNSDLSTTQGDSGGSLATAQWGEVAGVPNVTGGAAVSKLYQHKKKSQRVYTPTWNLNMIPSTKHEPDGKRIFVQEKLWFCGGCPCFYFGDV